jgi:hypothetical protein
MIVSVALPATAGQLQKKMLWQAQVKVGAVVKGGSILSPVRTGWDTSTRTWAYPGQVVTKVNLRISGDSREVVLCQNGSTTYDDCTYDADGNLNFDALVNGTSLFLAGITGQEFTQALTAETLLVELNTGAAGNYVRIY